MEISVTARDAAKVPTLSFSSQDLVQPAFHKIYGTVPESHNVYV